MLERVAFNGQPDVAIWGRRDVSSQCHNRDDKRGHAQCGQKDAFPLNLVPRLDWVKMFERTLLE